MKNIHFLLCGGLLVILINACSTSPKNYETKSENGHFQAVIEIPAGTNVKFEFDRETGAMVPDQENGKDRRIDFLGYPGNYGFIPGTMMDEEAGGDGDALDVLVLCDALKSGSLIEILPIATLRLRDQGELDTKIIAVPVDEGSRSMNVDKFSTLLTKYHMAQQIIQNWFLSYKGLGEIELIGWEDEQYALKTIDRWLEK